MTEHIQTPTGTLSIQRTSEVGRTFVMVTKDEDSKGLRVPTFELLAAIDAAEPESMRAYLRETAPEVIADLYRPEIPEADSPEDIDERVPPREALLTDAQERRLYLIEQLTKTLPADETPGLAHWIITGGTDTIEDLTLSGEEIGR